MAKKPSKPRSVPRQTGISPNPKKRMTGFYRELAKTYGPQRAHEIIRRMGTNVIVPAFSGKNFGPSDLQVLRHTAKVQNDIIELERKKPETR